MTDEPDYFWKAVASCECGNMMFVSVGSTIHRGEEKIVACDECFDEPHVVLADADEEFTAPQLESIRTDED